MNFLSVKKDRIIFLVAMLIVTIGGYSPNIKAQNNKLEVVSGDTIYAKSVVVKPHSPHRATFYSAILPGLGQAYNKKYWKIPILYAGIGGMIYGLDFNTRNYNIYRRAYRDFLIKDPGNTSYLDKARYRNYTKEQMIEFLATNPSAASQYQASLKNKKDYYKKYRDLSYVGLALIYVLNLVDASVDAHFKTFDVSNDLSMHIEPKISPMHNGLNSLCMQVKLTF